MKTIKTIFGKINGETVHCYKLCNDNGLQASCINYGCAITKIEVPDRNGKVENIVLGFPDLADYQLNSPYCGVVVGRVAGRIKKAQFELDGRQYKLEQNCGLHHLHGGSDGFSHKVWDSQIVDQDEAAGVCFRYTSNAGEGGYPGKLAVSVTYTLDNANQLKIAYQGKADQTTLFNPTNHTYFNLSGNCKEDILGHIFKIDSDFYLELDKELLPTGKLLKVAGTAFDFRTGRILRDGDHSEHPQNQLEFQGYDHPFILNSHNNREIVLVDPASGRRLTVETDAPAVVVYTGNQLSDNLNFCDGKSRKYLGICLETQGLPDAIHNRHFASCVLKKETVFSSATKYIFDIVPQ